MKKIIIVYGIWHREMWITDDDDDDDDDSHVRYGMVLGCLGPG